MEAKRESEVKKVDPAKVIAAGLKWRVRKDDLRFGAAVDGQEDDVSIGLLLHES